MKHFKPWQIAKDFPPEQERAIPEGYWRNGYRQTCIKHLWGEVRVDVRRLVNKESKAKQIIKDKRLDHSGWTPKALECLVDLVARLPLEEATVVARNFGLNISSSCLDRLSHPYREACQTEVKEQLLQAHEQRLANDYDYYLSTQIEKRTMVLQVDGVYVLGQPEKGVCVGLELKTAVLYPLNSPSQRWMLADRCSSDEFLKQLSGLLQKANVSAKDRLIGLGDGASWIDKSFDYLQALRITDVYHATEYLDTIMQAMNWDEQTRTEHRRAWYRGEVNAKEWLSQYLPEPDVWLDWSEKALTALNYLEARLDSMNYADFIALNYPIGSGQIEGMNKSVIGNRMKRSGMHWSDSGAANMAALRAQICAKHPMTQFESLRHIAFP